MKTDAGKVLIVDDDAEVLLAAELVLKRQFSVVTACTPASIEMLLAEHNFDVILLDMNFTAGATSGEEGIHWLRVARRLSPQAKVVLMTAYGGVDEAVNAMRAGAADFVVKPWDNAKLVATVSAVAHAQPRRARSAGAARAPTGAERCPGARLGAHHRRERRHAAGGGGHREGGAHRCQCAHHRARTAPARSWWRAPSTIVRCGRGCRSSASISAPSPSRCSNPNCSATGRARSPMRARTGQGASRPPWAARCSWTKSATCRWPCRPSCWARWRQ